MLEFPFMPVHAMCHQAVEVAPSASNRCCLETMALPDTCGRSLVAPQSARSPPAFRVRSAIP